MCAVAGIDPDAQVDVALADLDQVDAGAQLAAERLRLGAVDVELGGKLDQGLGFEAAEYSAERQSTQMAQRPGRAASPEIFLV